MGGKPKTALSPKQGVTRWQKPKNIKGVSGCEKSLNPKRPDWLESSRDRLHSVRFMGLQIRPAATMKRLGRGRPARTATQKAVPSSSSVRLTSMASSRPEAACAVQLEPATQEKITAPAWAVQLKESGAVVSSVRTRCRVATAAPMVTTLTIGCSVSFSGSALWGLWTWNAAAPARSNTRCRRSLLPGQQPQIRAVAVSNMPSR